MCTLIYTVYTVIYTVYVCIHTLIYTVYVCIHTLIYTVYVCIHTLICTRDNVRRQFGQEQRQGSYTEVSELRSSVNVEVDVLGSSFLISPYGLCARKATLNLNLLHRRSTV